MANEDAKKDNQVQSEGDSASRDEQKQSETTQINVVQQKKQELEDRMKSQGTIRLRQPGSGVKSQPASEGQAQQDKSDTYKFGKEAAADKTQETGTPDSGAKRTLKIKTGATAPRTSGPREAGGQPAQQPAASQPSASPYGAVPAPQAGPGAMGFLANLIAFLASAATFAFLLLYFLDLYL